MEIEMEQLLEFCLDIGEELLRCGAEIHRVEESIERLCLAYGCMKADVFCITSVIILTVHDAQGKIHTQMRRVTGYGNNMARLEAINTLCRRLCKQPEPVRSARTALEALRPETTLHPWRKWIGSVLAASGFALFFGGSAMDAVCALLVSLVICCMDFWVYRVDVNRLLYTLLCSFVAGAATLLLTRLGIGEHSGTIMIGAIMLLIPGVALTNSVRDMLGGDIIAGLLRLVESVIQAAAIAGGFAAAILAYGAIFV